MAFSASISNGVQAFFLQVIYKENGKVEVKPFYSAIELRNERGSKFSFKTEIHRSNLSEEDVF